MTRNEFYGYLHNTDTIETIPIEKIETIVAQYPYFQTAHLVHLALLHKTDHIAFSKQLQKIALLCADRKRLFYLLHKARYASFVKEKKKDKPKKTEMTSKLLNNFLEHIEEKKSTSAPTQEAPSVLNKEFGIISTDYIGYLNAMGTTETKGSKGKNNSELKHQSIIDRFIEQANSSERVSDYVFKEQKQDCNEYQIVDDKEEDSSFLTETLAQIYIKQKKYVQALSIIQRLSLNFPKKSVYFADQIRFLEYLILNEKHKKQ